MPRSKEQHNVALKLHAINRHVERHSYKSSFLRHSEQFCSDMVSFSLSVRKTNSADKLCYSLTSQRQHRGNLHKPNSRLQCGKRSKSEFVYFHEHKKHHCEHESSTATLQREQQERFTNDSQQVIYANKTYLLAIPLQILGGLWCNCKFKL